MSRYILKLQFPDFHIPERYSAYQLDPTGGGAGSLGVVKKFVSPDLPDIAIKRFINPFNTKTNAQLILRELHLLRSMQHPNIVQLLKMYTVEDNEEQMESIYHITYNCGVPLSKVIEMGTYRMEHVKRWTSELLSALHYLHSRGVSHRNLKPDNMCISQDNEQLTLTGFGKARVLTDEKNTAERGTDPYMAFEMNVAWDGTYDGKVDIWSAAAILCEMITGTTLFSGPKVKNLMKLTIEFCGPVEEAVLAKMKNKSDRQGLAQASAKAKRKDFIALLRGRVAGTRAIGDAEIMNEIYLEDFIDKTLQFDPLSRMSAEQAITHPFLSGGVVSVTHPLPDQDGAFVEYLLPENPVEALRVARHLIWNEIHS